jgi:hypothetical protein
MTYPCLVCAWPKLKEPPRSPSGGGSYEICPACGYQYGVDDDDRGITPEQWRRTWVQQGARWSSAGIKSPKGWKYQAGTAGQARQASTAAKNTIVLKSLPPKPKAAKMPAGKRSPARKNPG